MSAAADKLKKLIDIYHHAPPEQKREMEPDLMAAIKNPWPQLDPNSVIDKDMIEHNVPAPIGAMDRANIKNFGNSTHDAIRYLEDKYPKYEFAHDGREIYVKTPGHDKYFPMDPDNWNFDNNPINPKNWDMAHVKELAQDTGDVLYDTAAGLGQAPLVANSALAGAAATAPSGGWGAIPAGMGAAALTGAAKEAMRQGIGQGTGVNQGMDGGQIGMTAGLDAALFPIAGLGMSGPKALMTDKMEQGARQIVGNKLKLTAGEQGAMKIEDVLKELGKGGINGALPKAMSLTGSGVKNMTKTLTSTTPEAVQTMANEPGVIASRPENSIELAQWLRMRLNNLNQSKARVGGDMIDQGLESSKGIDAVPILKHLDDKIAASLAAAQKMSATEQVPFSRTIAYIQQLRDEFQHHAARNQGRIPPEAYNRLNQALADVMNLQPGNVPDAVAGAIARGNSNVAKAAKGTINRTADDESNLTEIGRQIWNEEKNASDMLGEKVGENGTMSTSKVRSLVGAEKPDPDIAHYVKSSMSPSDLGEYQMVYDALHANEQFNKARAFTPTGSLSLLTAPVAAGVKAANPQNVMRAGAATLRAGQAVAAPIRDYAPMAASALAGPNRDSALDLFAGSTGTTSEDTLSPVQKAKQADFLKRIMELGRQ